MTQSNLTYGLNGAGVALAVVVAGVMTLGPEVAPAPEQGAEQGAEQGSEPLQESAGEAQNAPSEPTAIAPSDPEPDIEPDTESAPVALAEQSTPDPAAQTDPIEPAEPPVRPPVFQTFRVDPDGIAVIVGRAGPDRDVAILIDGDQSDRTRADGRGDFTIITTLAPSDQPRTLALLADPDGLAVRSDATQIIAPFGMIVPESTTPEASEIAAEDVPDAPSDQIAEAVAETAVEEPASPENDSSTQSTSETGIAEPVSVEPDRAADPAPDTADPEPNPTPEPPAILTADADGVRVTQGGVAPEIMANVALDTITYDPGGEVAIAGRAPGQGFVQIYLDNQPITTSRIAEDGQWRSELPDIDTGIYTLRVDQLDTAGEVVSRIETPFLREEPDDVAAAIGDDLTTGQNIAMRTVQPGNTLWAISQEIYGDGVLYVHLFEANRDLIRNPDLIYPGQIFELPDLPDQ
jgi:nucleoid-associated protein YgaU